MKILKTDFDSAAIAARHILTDQIVIIPTDTVYGFSGLVKKGVESALSSLKGRNENKSFIRLIANPKDVFHYTNTPIPKRLFELWPAPLTLIVNSLDGKSTLAFRCPNDDWLRSLIQKVGQPIYSTSVNYSGKPVFQNIIEICKEFDGKVPLIVDGGNGGGLASTVADISGGSLKILRLGSIDLNSYTTLLE